MTAKIIDGVAVSTAIRTEIAQRVVALRDKGVTPGLAVIVVGSDPASAVYVRNKMRACAEVGIRSFKYEFAADCAPEPVLDLIAELNSRADVHGILVQLPLPKHLDPQRVVSAIDPAKDVDGLTPVSTGRLALGLPGMVPCTPLGSLLMLQEQLGDLSGLDAVVIGRSILVGKPMAQLLLNANATVTIAHSRTKDLPDVVRRADIVVAAVGRPEMVKAEWIKPGATVIDVGINRLLPEEGQAKGRLVGDVDFAHARNVAGAITPVPGGVGPMTIACLLHNTLVAAERREGVSSKDI